VIALYATISGVTTTASIGTLVGLDNSVSGNVAEATIVFDAPLRFTPGDQLTLGRNGDSGSDTFDAMVVYKIVAY
jgi:hypothetical protein